MSGWNVSARRQRQARDQIYYNFGETIPSNNSIPNEGMPHNKEAHPPYQRTNAPQPDQPKYNEKPYLPASLK